MTSEAKVHSWCQPLPDTEAAAQIERVCRLPGVRQVAVMPDAHAGAVAPNGVAVATADRLYPQLVGGDIGCGYLALAFHGQPRWTDRGAETLLAAALASVPILRRRRPLAMAWRGGFSSPTLSRALRRLAEWEVGTLGRGNHFAEVQRAREDGRYWLLIHSGSRGLGQAILAHHAAAGERVAGGLAVLTADSAVGRAYLADQARARAFARLNRLHLALSMARLLHQHFGLAPALATLTQADHNHVVSSPWGWVHRKGAALARAGAVGMVPGSMGTATYHVAGRGCAAALDSCAHGAGRLVPRGAAEGRIAVADLRRQMRGIAYPQRLDLRTEAPAAYKEIGAVMRAQRDLVRIVRVLDPLLCVKGG